MKAKLIAVASKFYLVADVIGYPGVNVYSDPQDKKLIVSSDDGDATQFTTAEDAEVELYDNGKFTITSDGEEGEPTTLEVIAYKRVDWNTENL